ncbi:hypothetical protein BZA77DRAFT_139458 [Pyronema omphalodes]|nr:hypothetical protein BZA77DRAFT_139458 [Pyronema omphalodes]
MLFLLLLWLCFRSNLAMQIDSGVIQMTCDVGMDIMRLYWSVFERLLQCKERVEAWYSRFIGKRLLDVRVDAVTTLGKRDHFASSISTLEIPVLSAQTHHPSNPGQRLISILIKGIICCRVVLIRFSGIFCFGIAFQNSVEVERSVGCGVNSVY